MDNLLDVRLSEIENDDELFHYGVKGMKWGVRRQYRKLGSQEARQKFVKNIDKKWEDKIKANPKTGKIAARAARKSNRDIKRLKKEYKRQGYKFGRNTLNSRNIENRRNRIAKSQYEATVKDIIQSNLEREANRVHKSSKSRLQKVEISQQSDGSYQVKVVPNSNYKINKQLVKVAKKDAKRLKKEAKLAKRAEKEADNIEKRKALQQSAFIIHAEEAEEDDIDFEGLTYILTVDEDGFFDELIMPGMEIEHTLLSEIEAENELMHYGVKGMKWGVRRARKSASKTVSGVKSKAAKKISEIKSDRAKVAAAKRKANNKVALAKVSAKEKVKLNEIETKADAKIAKTKNEVSSKVEKSSVNNSSKAPQIKGEKSLREMSNQELQDRINRANLEKNYMKIVEESRPKSAGEVMANYAKAKAMKAGDKVVDKLIEKGTEEIASMAFSKVKEAATSQNKSSKDSSTKEGGNDSVSQPAQSLAKTIANRRQAAKAAKVEAKAAAEKKAAEDKKKRVQQMMNEHDARYGALQKRRADKKAAAKKAEDDYYNELTDRFVDSVRKDRKKKKS